MEELKFNGTLLAEDLVLKNRILGFWSTPLVQWTVFADSSDVMSSFQSNELPGVLVCSMSNKGEPGLKFAEAIKSENIYRQVPVIICLSQREFEEQFDLSKSEVDEFFILPGTDDELKARIELAVRRSRRNLDANPLTMLPGNTSIINYLQECISRKDAFSMGYCDLDFFKSFNDRYGFARGDEVLMMTARIIVNIMRQVSPDNYFVGHVGGDDFIFAIPTELAETACQKIIAAFDNIVPQFYDAEDRQKGGIISLDRQGVLRSFPMMAISIAVVSNYGGKLKHVGEASQIAMNLKKKAKENPKSSYVLDRRTFPANE